MRFVVLVHDDHVAWDWHTEGCNLLREHGEVEFLCLPTGLQINHISGAAGKVDDVFKSKKSSANPFLEPTDEVTTVLEDFYSQLETADAAVIGAWYRPPMLPEHWAAAEKLKVFSGTFDHRFGDWFEQIKSRDITLIDTSRSMTCLLYTSPSPRD